MMSIDRRKTEISWLSTRNRVGEMLLAQVKVIYESGWTSDLRPFDVYGEWPVSTYYDGGKYLGLCNLYTSDFDEVMETIRSRDDIVDVEVIKKVTHGDKTTATLIERESDIHEPPLFRLREAGYMPLPPVRLEDGWQVYDFILENNQDVAEIVEILSVYGTVQTSRISQGFDPQIHPSPAEWQELVESITPAQIELLQTAIDHGYFETPRETTLEEIGDELQISKTTTCNHLRRIQSTFAKFLIKYIR